MTVAFSLGPDLNEKVNFNIVKLPIRKYKRWIFHKTNIYKFCQDFDTVIVYGDLAWLKYICLPFRRNRSFKVIFWTIGVSASYDKKYDAISKWNNIRDFFYKQADALVLYSNYPIQQYIKRGFNPKKLFVAPNTVEVLNDISNQEIEKDSLLFIGTLYLQKGISVLLENYKRAYLFNPNILPLNIIGSGPEYKNIEVWIKENFLDHKIFLRGPIFDVKKKAAFFYKAFACISPIQAGLSVLESLGYGVPFVTMHDALTGGERLNIQNAVNGILLRDVSDLEHIILDISKNSSKYLEMGKNGREYYNKYRTPNHMADGLIDAINYVSN